MSLIIYHDLEEVINCFHPRKKCLNADKKKCTHVTQNSHSGTISKRQAKTLL
uniref:Uncharacterized protein n=1 Tax=Anguilla anguilla TaxID=7936 RepID=A0A0E9U312_ANGAN